MICNYSEIIYKPNSQRGYIDKVFLNIQIYGKVLVIFNKNRSDFGIINCLHMVPYTISMILCNFIEIMFRGHFSVLFGNTFRNFGLQCSSTSYFIWPFLTFLDSSVTDESFVDETHVWRIYKIQFWYLWWVYLQ